MSPRNSGGAERPLETLRLTESRAEAPDPKPGGRSAPPIFVAVHTVKRTIRGRPARRIRNSFSGPQAHGAIREARAVGGDEAARQSSAGQLSTVGERLSWKFNPAVVSFTTPARIR